MTTKQCWMFNPPLHQFTEQQWLALNIDAVRHIPIPDDTAVTFYDVTTLTSVVLASTPGNARNAIATGTITSLGASSGPLYSLSTISLEQ